VSTRLVLLALAVLPAATLAAPAPLPRPERRYTYVPPDDLADLVHIAERRGDVRRGAQHLRAKFADVEAVERAYKPPLRGGLGLGPPSDSVGIGQELLRLRLRLVPGGEFRAKMATVRRLAYSVVAITELARLFPPDTPNRRGKGAREWDVFADETVRAALDLARAADGDDARDVQAAARKVNSACYNCHDEFRE
jgi:hypothetical protein